MESAVIRFLTESFCSAGFALGRSSRLAFLGLSLLSLWVPVSAQPGADSIQFIGVAPDDEYEQADAALVGYLSRATGETFIRRRPADYSNAISDVVNRSTADGHYVARLTPYAFVVAEMEGAQLEILGTYLSRATGAYTYNSYFVVRSDEDVFRTSVTPSLADVAEFLRSGKKRFVFHDKFSTSSYFIPSIFFRSNQVFNTEVNQRIGKLTPLEVAQAPPGSGSSELVRMVKSGDADIAAVWDGTKNGFQESSDQSALRFVQIQTPLPNDLLVCSRSLSRSRKEALKRAVREMNCDSLEFAGDFECWAAMNDAGSAREALAALRRHAVATTTPVTVMISGSGEDGSAYVEAAEQAVRLAGTEFVLYDPDYHKWADVSWQIKPIHKGALLLTSTINGSLLPSQEFRISFMDVAEDLPKRIQSLIHGRMHRIRYVWPYENYVPTIIRDVSFSLSPGSDISVEKVTWIDPERNEFVSGAKFNATVLTSDKNKFELDPEDFPRSGAGKELDLDPLSNSAYRVILARPFIERPLFRYLTVALVGVMLAGAFGAIVDLRRRKASLWR